MTNSLEAVYTAFFDKVEQDTDFFDYFGLSETRAMQIAKERAHSYLLEACSYLRRQVSLDFELATETVSGVEQFKESITEDELYLLADIMLLIYFERELGKLKPKLNTFNASELKLLHSPANERQSYLALISQQRENVRVLISDYYAKDRTTGAEKILTTTIPEETEE